MLSREREGGFTLVELLVVVTLLGIVGAVGTTAMIRALKTADKGQARVYGLADVQKGVERMSRELRAADPVETMSATSVSARVYRNGLCYRYTYALVGSEIRETLERLSPNPGVFNECTAVVSGTSATTVLVRGLTNTSTTPLFSYYAQTAPTMVAATGLGDLRQIVIDARSAPSGTPLRVSTSVQIRNFDTERYRSQS